MNVYIVSSTCGGTGTGMFLDVAYISRHVVANQFGKEPWVRALLLLPFVFLGTGQVADQNAQNLRGERFRSAYGVGLCDVEGCEPETHSVPGGAVRFSRGGAIQELLLVGNQAAAGAVFNDFEDLEERCAVHIQIELASPLTQQGAASMDNVLQQIAVKPDAQGRRRLYSSFNGDWLGAPECPDTRALDEAPGSSNPGPSPPTGQAGARRPGRRRLRRVEKRARIRRASKSLHGAWYQLLPTARRSVPRRVHGHPRHRPIA